jgi:two-component system KDP operon response regulator KdpE
MPERILIIDDEAQITRVLRAALAAQAYDVRIANDPQEALLLFEDWSPDLIITDLVMPGMSGIEVCQEIRKKTSTPIIVLSVRDQERSKVEALDAGADDYVTKPFSVQDQPVEVGDFVVDAQAHSVTVLGRSIHLTPKEFDLLLHFARNSGKVVTHRALLTAVWGAQSVHQPEYLRVFIGQLRRKLESGSEKQYFQTEPWVGYRFLPEGSPE